MLKKLILSVIVIVLATASVIASSPYGSGSYLRVGAGFPDNINVGVGYDITGNLSLGIEATSVNALGGYAGAFDLRYHLGESTIRPFVDMTVGYGVLGRTIDYKNHFDLVSSVSAGVGYRRFDFGIGLTYDSWNDVMPLVSISYTIPLRRQ